MLIVRLLAKAVNDLGLAVRRLAYTLAEVANRADQSEPAPVLLNLRLQLRLFKSWVVPALVILEDDGALATRWSQIRAAGSA